MTLVPDSEVLNAGFRYAFALTMNRQDAEDLVHDSWIRLITRYGESPQKPVLFRTIRNLFIDGTRHSRIVENYARSQDRSASEPDGADAIINAELLEQSMKVLRPIEREVLFLSVIEGYTADEIATMQSTVRGTILSMLSRTKKKLRQVLEPDGLRSTAKGDVPFSSNVVPLSTASDNSLKKRHRKGS